MPITFSVPIFNLEDFEEQKWYKKIEHLHNFKQTNNEYLSSKILNNFLRIDNSLINSCKFYNVTDEDRVESIKKLLRLDHFNQDEYEHVKNIIKNNADRFQIPGEPLEAANVLQHSIPTVDDSPIFERQHRFPTVHKKEITIQVDFSQGKIKWRMVLDFRKLNEKTIGDSYHLPNI